MWLNRILSSTRSDTGPFSQFYSWYIYPENEAELGRSVSSAEFVDDVNEDSIVIVDGLTKVRASSISNHSDPDVRCRTGVFLASASAGLLAPRTSSRPSHSPAPSSTEVPATRTSRAQAKLPPADATFARLQLAAIPRLDPDHVFQEKVALQRHFKHKRDHVLKRLARLGLKVAVPPESTFYIWLNLEHLPSPLNNGLVRRVLTMTVFTLISLCRRSSRSSSRKSASSSPASSSTSTPLTAATSSRPRATISCASRSAHLSRPSTWASTRWRGCSSVPKRRVFTPSDTTTRRASTAPRRRSSIISSVGICKRCKLSIRGFCRLICILELISFSAPVINRNTLDIHTRSIIRSLCVRGCSYLVAFLSSTVQSSALQEPHREP